MKSKYRKKMADGGMASMQRPVPAGGKGGAPIARPATRPQAAGGSFNPPGRGMVGAPRPRPPVMGSRPMAMAEGGSVKAKSGKGYTSEQRSALARLLEMIQPDAGDYTGEGVVTEKKPAQKKRGGGLARRGKGMALAEGGIVGRPARSYRDMRAGAGSGVGRIQKTKIQRGR